MIREIALSLLDERGDEEVARVVNAHLQDEMSIGPFGAGIEMLERRALDVSALHELAQTRFPSSPIGSRRGHRPTSVTVRAETERRATNDARSDNGWRFSNPLNPDRAPDTVEHIASLVDQRFYDGVAIHRHVPGFVVQTGCPRGDGWGGPGRYVRDEVSSVPFEVGSVGMARSHRNTNGSQWFVSLDDFPHLTGEYTLFGQVVQGLDVVRRLGVGDRLLEVRLE